MRSLPTKGATKPLEGEEEAKRSDNRTGKQDSGVRIRLLTTSNTGKCRNVKYSGTFEGNDNGVYREDGTDNSTTNYKVKKASNNGSNNKKASNNGSNNQGVQSPTTGNENTHPTTNDNGRCMVDFNGNFTGHKNGVYRQGGTDNSVTNYD